MKQKAAVFILRKEPDLDNITPIIYKISEQNSDIDINVIITPEINMSDYRIQFIKKQDNVNIYNVLELGSSTESNSISRSNIHKIKKYGELFPTEVPSKIWNKFVASDVSSIYPHGSIIFDKFSTYSQIVILFDWPPSLEKDHGQFIQQVINRAKKEDVYTVALPHGASGVTTVLNHINVFKRSNYNLDDIFYTKSTANSVKGYDYLIAPDKIKADNHDKVDEEVVKILGSARYCPEWIEINCNICPEYNLSFDSDEYSILMFVNKPRNGLYWKEIYRTIRLLSRTDKINLVIKGHPRHSYENILENVQENNSWVLKNDIPSVCLLNWSDIVISIGGSSIEFSAIVRDLPLLEAEYMSATYSTVSSQIQSCDVTSRDKLFNILQNHKNKTGYRVYSEKERVNFINNVISSTNKDVLNQYVQFISSLFD